MNPYLERLATSEYRHELILLWTLRRQILNAKQSFPKKLHRFSRTLFLDDEAPSCFGVAVDPRRQHFMIGIPDNIADRSLYDTFFDVVFGEVVVCSPWPYLFMPFHSSAAEILPSKTCALAIPMRPSLLKCVADWGGVYFGRMNQHMKFESDGTDEDWFFLEAIRSKELYWEK